MVTKPAAHGGDVFAAARELGWPWTRILDFSASVNPLGPPPGLKKLLFDSFDVLQHYPDPWAWGWRTQLAGLLGLSPEEILPGNGTTALMYLLARTLAPSRVAVAVPAFAEYEQALLPLQSKIERVPCAARDDFDLTPKVVDRLFAAHPDLVFLANPTSPAGRLVAGEILERALTLAKKTGAVLVLDEAFLDFTPAPSLAGEVRRHPQLIVLRSLTKFYALPGLRLGFLTAAGPLARRLTAQAEPWAVNSLAQIAGGYCLNQTDYAARTVTLVNRERAWLTKRMNGLGLGRVVPATANYLLMKIDAADHSENELLAALRSQGVLIRGCASFAGLSGYVRFAVKTRRLNQRLVAALEPKSTAQCGR